MKEIDLIKIVFELERVDFELRQYKSRKAELVQAKQRAMYMLKFFFHDLTWSEVGAFCGQKHDGAIHAYNKVTNFIATEKRYENEIARMISIISGKMKNNLKVNCVSAEYRMINKRIALTRLEGPNEGEWLVFSKVLDDKKKIQKRHLIFTDEALTGLFQMYNLLNK